MTRMRHIWLKNVMLLGNLLANFVGIGLVTFLLSRPISGLPQAAWEFLDRVGWHFDPIAFAALACIILIYERPIRHYLNLQFAHTVIPSALELKARQKMLNKPYFLRKLGTFLNLWSFS